MGKGINCNKGFTLIELLVGLAISCIVVAAAYSFVLSGIKSYDRTRKATELQQETQFIENIIADTVANGIEGESSIDKSISGIIKFETGKHVLYYNKLKKTLALYENTDGDTVGDSDTLYKHIVSKNVSDFNVAYLAIEPEIDSSGNQIEETTNETGLVKVTVEVELNGKTDRSVNRYKLRNKK